MILVTGATGRIGRRVVKRLVANHEPVRVLVRDPDKARTLLSADIEIFEGNLGQRDLVQSAVSGSRSVLLLSPVDPAQVELQGNVVKAALETTQPHIVKISGLGTALDSYVDSGRWHAETEHQIQSSGLPYTFLRPLYFMQNLAFLLDSARSKGIIRSGVGDAKIAMIDVEDIAEIATRVLIEPGHLMNQAVTLTALQAVTYHDVARELTALLGRTVHYEQQSLEDVMLALKKTDEADWHVKILLQFNRAFLEGYGDAANQFVADMLGRSPSTLSQYLRQLVKHADLNDDKNPFPS